MYVVVVPKEPDALGLCDTFDFSRVSQHSLDTIPSAEAAVVGYAAYNNWGLNTEYAAAWLAVLIAHLNVVGAGTRKSQKGSRASALMSGYVYYPLGTFALKYTSLTAALVCAQGNLGREAFDASKARVWGGNDMGAGI